MKKQKLTKLALVATGAMLLAGCGQERERERAALREATIQAIENKLNQMSAADADAYIREQMKGKHKWHIESETLGGWEKEDRQVIEYRPVMDLMDLIFLLAGDERIVDDELYVDFWEANDTNGTLVDEYVTYARGDYHLETEVKAQVKAEFKANKKKRKLQAKLENVQKQLDELDAAAVGAEQAPDAAREM